MKNKFLRNIVFCALPFAFIIGSCNLDVPENVSYKVEHYLQNVDNDEYTLYETEELNGKDGELSVANAKAYKGFNALDFEQINISSGSKILIKYDRNLITCTFDYKDGYIMMEDGTKQTYRVLTGRYGAPLEKPEPLRTGYILEEWYDADGNCPEDVFTENTTYYASYVTKNSSYYTVKHFFQNMDNDEYTENASAEEKLQGKAGTKTAAKALNDITGFTVKDIQQKIISNDDSTQVNVYYDRIPVTFYFDLAGGNGATQVTKKYGTVVSSSIVKNPEKAKSEFSGWNPDLPGEFTKDCRFTAVWDMPAYTVKYRFENINDSDYSSDENYPDEIYYGNSGTKTSFIPKNIPGFIAEPVSQITISSNGQNVLEVFYKRKIITLYINLNGGVGVNYIQGKFGEENAAVLEKLSNIRKPSRTGYGFDETNGYVYSDEVKFSLEYDETTPIAVKWIGGVISAYEVVVLKEKLDYEGIGQKYDEADRVVLTGKSNDKTSAVLDSETQSIVLDGKSWHYDYYEPCNLENVEISGDESTVLYLYFDRNSVDLTFKLNGGSINGISSDVVVKGKYNSRFELPEELENVERKGYTFTSWDKTFERFPETNETVNAVWTGNTYKVTLHGNGQTEEKSYTYGQTFVLPSIEDLSEITQPEGYGLSGWSFTEGSAPKYLVTESTVFDAPGDIELYSCWGTNYYTVKVYEEKLYANNTFVYGDIEYYTPTEKKYIQLQM